jgi:hypothetical protein
MVDDIENLEARASVRAIMFNAIEELLTLTRSGTVAVCIVK